MRPHAKWITKLLEFRTTFETTCMLSFPPSRDARASRRLYDGEPVLQDMRNRARGRAGTTSKSIRLLPHREGAGFTDVDTGCAYRLHCFGLRSLHDVTLRKRSFLYRYAFFFSPQVAQRSGCQPASAHSVGNLW